jgi:N-acetylmuramoyl-L-alanine amidase
VGADRTTLRSGLLAAAALVAATLAAPATAGSSPAATVRAFGDAGSYGSPAPTSLLVGLARTADGKGYWTVDDAGRVSAFGDATALGSAPALNQPVVGMAATPDGGGYWLVAADGGIFSFGDARFEGAATEAAAPVVGMAATPDGGGYWVVTSGGTVYPEGDARPEGEAAQTGVAGIVATRDGGGYWTVASGAVLAGRVVADDPGHDGGNGADPAYIDAPIWNGIGYESCDTAGTETASGYTEHAYNFDVALRLEAILEAEGARVVMTRTTDTGVGPCVNVRAEIGNDAHADAAVSIHADGGPVGGRGFTVIEPTGVSPAHDANVGASGTLGADMASAYQAVTGLPPSTYDGVDGIDHRDDLGGLNLSTVPKVLIETGNMQNPTDAALLEDPAFRQKVAEGIAAGITDFLTGAT